MLAELFFQSLLPIGWPRFMTPEYYNYNEKSTNGHTSTCEMKFSELDIQDKN
jgi:hypothetical protein